MIKRTDGGNIKITKRECRQKLGLNRKDKYAQNRRNKKALNLLDTYDGQLSKTARALGINRYTFLNLKLVLFNNCILIKIIYNIVVR